MLLNATLSMAAAQNSLLGIDGSQQVPTGPLSGLANLSAAADSQGNPCFRNVPHNVHFNCRGMRYLPREYPPADLSIGRTRLAQVRVRLAPE